jgi:hypothetical protein
MFFILTRGVKPMATMLSKREAIEAVKRESSLTLSYSTTHFANVNARKSVWWFDIPVEKFTSDKYDTLDILVASTDAKELHHLRVPTTYVRDNPRHFHVRKDKDSVSLELSSLSTNKFQDVRPGSGKMPFLQFVVKTIALAS